MSEIWRTLLNEDMKIERLMGLPHAARNPGPYRAELAHDAYEIIRQIQSYSIDLQNQMASPKLTRMAREKIKKVLADYQKHLVLLSKHLAPLDFARISAGDHRSYSSRRKPAQRLMSYYGNIARDWAWGADENLTGLKLIQQKAADSGFDFSGVKTILVIGAGACRLPYEVHRWLKPDATVCVDYNPLLLTVAKNLIAGEKLLHVDFPNVPLDGESFTIPYELSAPEKIESGMEFLVHDLTEWGFKEGSVDMILTPWIIDVIPVLPTRLFAQINSVLKPGGLWVNYGPLNFSRPRLTDNWTLKEVVHQVGKSGFEIAEPNYSRVPHLQNPHSAHGRLDYVLTFCARKTEDVEIPEDEALEGIPAWVNDPAQAIAPPPGLKELQASLNFAYELSTKLESGLTLPELAAFMSAKYSIPFDDAEVLVKSTLLGWVSSSRFNPMK